MHIMHIYILAYMHTYAYTYIHTYAYILRVPLGLERRTGL